jgi:methionyl-tRNA formyltransferase
MRVIFCGSGSFAVPTLQAIVAAGHEVPLVVTQPPRPAGRGGKLRATPVSEAAAALSLETLATDNVNAEPVIAAAAAKAADVIAVADFGQFVRAGFRGTARIDSINLHGSVLPELRGAAPINWAIIRGHPTTGVTTFSLVDKMDAGVVYLQESTPICPAETAEELRVRLAKIGAGVVLRTLEMLAGGAKGVAQDESKVTKAPVLKKTDGVIDWSAPAVAIRNRIHGTWPWPGGHTMFQRNGDAPIAMTLGRAAVEPGPATGEAGVLDKDLCVATGDGRLRVLELQPAGKRLMAWRDFINGYRI